MLFNVDLTRVFHRYNKLRNRPFLLIMATPSRRNVRDAIQQRLNDIQEHRRREWETFARNAGELPVPTEEHDCDNLHEDEEKLEAQGSSSSSSPDHADEIAAGHQWFGTGPKYNTSQRATQNGAYHPTGIRAPRLIFQNPVPDCPYFGPYQYIEARARLIDRRDHLSNQPTSSDQKSDLDDAEDPLEQTDPGSSSAQDAIGRSSDIREEHQSDDQDQRDRDDASRSQYEEYRRLVDIGDNENLDPTTRCDSLIQAYNLAFYVPYHEQRTVTTPRSSTRPVGMQQQATSNLLRTNGRAKSDSHTRRGQYQSNASTYYYGTYLGLPLAQSPAGLYGTYQHDTNPFPDLPIQAPYGPQSLTWPNSIPLTKSTRSAGAAVSANQPLPLQQEIARSEIGSSASTHTPSLRLPGGDNRNTLR